MTTILIEKFPFLRTVRANSELIAAIVSGVLIFFAWFSTGTAFSIFLYVLAFIIGGYAKAKEGILETIETKRLNVELLMVFAAIGSACIGYWTEGAILIFIFALSGALETYTMNKSERELSALLKLQPETATLIDRNGNVTEVTVSSLSVGSRLLVKPGEIIPVDGVIVEGKSTIDESALSGEATPVSKATGDDVFAGTINMSGALVIKMTKPNEETLFQKIIDLVMTAKEEKSPTQLFIERFEGTYVKVVLIAVLAMIVVPPLFFHWSWTEAIYRAMVLLVVASPCALVASIMPATLAAISNGAKRGVLFKGGVHVEHVGALKAIALDKTGTLTEGKPVVTDFIVRDDIDEEKTLQLLARIESRSNHPLAMAITNYAKEKGIEFSEPVEMEDVPGWGIKAFIEGKEYLVGKPAFVGSAEANAFQNGVATKLADEGKTVIFLRDERGIAALVALKDILRPEAVEAISTLKKLGKKVVLLTGDNEKTAKAIAKEANIDTYVAECLPEDKVNELKKLAKTFKHVGMVGDGINDAPALATATTGIAMGDGTGVALETADVVLMKNDLKQITYAIRLSKKMNRIIKQNICFSVLVIIALIVGNFMQTVDLPLGVIGHEGSTILVILNGLRLLNSNL